MCRLRDRHDSSQIFRRNRVTVFNPVRAYEPIADYGPPVNVSCMSRQGPWRDVVAGAAQMARHWRYRVPRRGGRLGREGSEATE
jgi:hypothetical protein